MRTKWTFEKLQEVALKYDTRHKFKVGDYNAYNTSVRRGILDEICYHMSFPTNQEYTEEELFEEAKKYNRRVDFQRESVGAYQAAWKRGILDEICSHMFKKNNIGENHPMFKWTYEALLSEAIKYNTIAEFKKNSNSAYVIAHQRNILNKVCSHMKPSRGSSEAEKELRKILKNTFSDAKPLRDSKVFIDNKPHIHGFDLDIFIPELNKGIEFDGKYWHSFDGLKKSRKHWPDEDILNYHKIKDDYFLSKGIQILHIKEEDWIKDKEDCIKRCLMFLSIVYTQNVVA